MTDLHFDGGDGPDIINVDSTGAAASTRVNAGAATTAINVCPTSLNMDGIGSLTLNGAGEAALTVNDQGAGGSVVPRPKGTTTYTVDGGALIPPATRRGKAANPL